MNKELNNRYEFVLVFDVKNGNPNGDPDGGNMPRIDPETGHGITTDVCLKRKVRNYVTLVKNDESPYSIYVKEKSVLSDQRKPAYAAVGGDKAEKINLARDWMCQNFYDIRTFGAVMSTKENNCGQVRGPVQLAFSQSIDPILPLDASITRMAVETPKEAESQSGDNRTMGRKAYIPYGLYRVHGFVSVAFARQTGFNEDDLELFWLSLVNMFDHDRSAARGEMASRKLIVFKHNDKLGNAPAHKLFSLVKITRKDINKPPRCVEDYEISIDESSCPDGVKIISRI